MAELSDSSLFTMAVIGGGALFFAAGTLTLILVGKLRRSDDCRATATSTLLSCIEIFNWLALLGATIMMARGFLRIPEHVHAWTAPDKAQGDSWDVDFE